MKSFSGRFLPLAYLGGAPAVVATLALMVTSEQSAKVRWTVAVVSLVVWLVAPLVLRERVLGRVRALSSVLEAFREGDYSIRTRDHRDDSPLGEAARELNALGEVLRAHRLGAAEATALLDVVMDSIDVVVLALDEAGAVRLANAAAERWLGQPTQGETADTLSIRPLLTGPERRLLSAEETRAMGVESGPMNLVRSRFRQGGKRLELLVLADVGSALRQKEREAWQRLVRVLGHEINSSLAPMMSLADSLRALSDARPDGWEGDLHSGLEVIGRRAGGLSRFMSAYATLAKLPPPNIGAVSVATVVRRNAALEQRLEVRVEEGPDARMAADSDQIDQVLINLVKNATDAALAGSEAPTVTIGWEVVGERVTICVEDSGLGISNSDNLFVPFFTTKPEGTGIGLVLSRQIAEAHGGTLELAGGEQRGARASLSLPRA